MNHVRYYFCVNENAFLFRIWIMICTVSYIYTGLCCTWKRQWSQFGWLWVAGRPGGLQCSGSPRVLLVLVHEVESRRGEMLNSLAKKKKRMNCWERLAWVSTVRRKSTREELKYFVAIKMKGTNLCSGEGGKEPAVWPRIWVTARRKREKKKGEDNIWDGKTKRNKTPRQSIRPDQLVPTRTSTHEETHLSDEWIII